MQELTQTMSRVEERKAATNELLEQMGQQRGEQEKEQASASKKRILSEKIAKEAAEIEADAEVELSQAQPAMQKAAEAVNCLTKSSLTAPLSMMWWAM